MSGTATGRAGPVSLGGLGRGRLGQGIWPGIALGAVAGAVALSIAACGGGSGSGSTGAGSSGGGPVSGTKVTVSLTEFHVGLSQQSFKPGTYTFVVSNDGSVTHALDVTGPGLSNADTSDLSPGQKTNLTVTLQAGSYDFFCPIGNHKQLGMNMNVSVSVSGGSASGGGSSNGGGGSGY